MRLSQRTPYANERRETLAKHWTEEDHVICPDCGRHFGSRSLTGSFLQVFLRPNPEPRCKYPEARTKDIIACPRAKEAIAAAEAEASSHDQD